MLHRARGGRIGRGYQPLKVHAIYRQLASCDPTPEGMLRFVKAFGFLESRTARQELVYPADAVEGTLKHIWSVRRLLGAIDAEDWDTIEGWADKLGKHVVHVNGQAPKGQRFGIQALESQRWFVGSTIADADWGLSYGKCKRPGCPEFFRIGRAAGGLREGAEYCSPKCQKAHTYMKSREQG